MGSSTLFEWCVQASSKIFSKWFQIRVHGLIFGGSILFLCFSGQASMPTTQDPIASHKTAKSTVCDMDNAFLGAAGPPRAPAQWRPKKRTPSRNTSRGRRSKSATYIRRLQRTEKRRTARRRFRDLRKVGGATRFLHKYWNFETATAQPPRDKIKIGQMFKAVQTF